MLERICHTRFLGLCIVVVAACTGAGPQEPEFSGGSFVLNRFAGELLPVDRGAVATRDGETTECRILVASGRMEIDTTSGNYSYSYELRNSCNNALLGASESAGTFSRQGAHLVLSVGGSQTAHIEGEIAGDTVTVFDANALEFIREP